MQYHDIQLFMFILYKRILTNLPANLVSDAVYAPVTTEIHIHES